MNRPIHTAEWKRGYNAGYKACKTGVNKPSKHIADRKFTHDQQDKYSRMWSETNAHQLPEELPVFANADSQSFQYGAWSVLEELRKDGLLPEATIDKWWKKVTKS